MEIHTRHPGPSDSFGFDEANGPDYSYRLPEIVNHENGPRAEATKVIILQGFSLEDYYDRTMQYLMAKYHRHSPDVHWKDAQTPSPYHKYESYPSDLVYWPSDFSHGASSSLDSVYEAMANQDAYASTFRDDQIAHAVPSGWRHRGLRNEVMRDFMDVRSRFYRGSRPDEPYMMDYIRWQKENPFAVPVRNIVGFTGNLPPDSRSSSREQYHEEWDNSESWFGAHTKTLKEPSREVYTPASSSNTQKVQDIGDLPTRHGMPYLERGGGQSTLYFDGNNWVPEGKLVTGDISAEEMGGFYPYD